MERRGRARRVRARVSFWEAFWEASVWMRLSCSVFSPSLIRLDISTRGLGWWWKDGNVVHYIPCSSIASGESESESLGY